MKAATVTQGSLRPKLPASGTAGAKAQAASSGGTTGGLGQTGRAGALRGRSDMEQHFDKLKTYDKLEEAVDSVGPKGLAQLCTEINVTFNDLDFLILMWKIGATQSYCISRSEWMHAAYIYKVEHVIQFKTNLTQWKAAVLGDKATFTEFYHAIFDFIRGDDDKWLPLDKALRAWAVLLPEGERFKHLSLWAQWCTLEYKRPITRDIWRELWEFAKKVDDLSQYDGNEKWPTAFDDFVEWANERKGLSPRRQ